MQLTEDAHNDV